MKYQFRENKKEERSIELKETGLVYTSTKDGEKQIPYSSITKIQLYSPLKEVYICEIFSKDSKKIVLANRSFVSLANFEFQNEGYVLFLKELHNRLSSRNDIEFAGGTSFWYYFMLIFLPLIILVIIWVTILAYEHGRRMPISIFVGFIIILPFAIQMIRKGKKINYTPDNIPYKYLP